MFHKLSYYHFRNLFTDIDKKIMSLQVYYYLNLIILAVSI